MLAHLKRSKVFTNNKPRFTTNVRIVWEFLFIATHIPYYLGRLRTRNLCSYDDYSETRQEVCAISSYDDYSEISLFWRGPAICQCVQQPTPWSLGQKNFLCLTLIHTILHYSLTLLHTFQHLFTLIYTTISHYCIQCVQQATPGLWVRRTSSVLLSPHWS